MGHPREYRGQHLATDNVLRNDTPRLRIPRSTTGSWLSRGCRTVVSLDRHHDIAAVLDENEGIKRRHARRCSVWLKIDVASFWGRLGEFLLDPVHFVADGIGDLASELN